MRLSHALVLAAMLLATPILHADFNDDRKAAHQLTRQGKTDEAIKALRELAGKAETDLQRTQALEDAVTLAARARNYDLATQMAKEIPQPAASFNAQAHVLSYQKKWQEILDLLHEVDRGNWAPEDVASSWNFIGNAHAGLNQGKEAVDAYKKAFDVAPQSRTAPHSLLAMGNAYRDLLKDPEQAIACYQQVYENTSNTARQAEAAVYTAQIYMEQNELAKALAELEKMNMLKLTSTFQRVQLLSTKAQIYLKQDQKDKAIEAYKEALSHFDIHPSQKKMVEEELSKLESPAAQ